MIELGRDEFPAAVQTSDDIFLGDAEIISRVSRLRFVSLRGIICGALFKRPALSSRLFFAEQ